MLYLNKSKIYCDAMRRKRWTSYVTDKNGDIVFRPYRHRGLTGEQEEDLLQHRSVLSICLFWFSS